jgi:hypothetical protein
VTPADGKLWKLKFRNAISLEKKLALGAYAPVDLCVRAVAVQIKHMGRATPY